MPPASQSASPLPGLLLLLSATTGLVDAVSVLGCLLYTSPSPRDS